MFFIVLNVKMGKSVRVRQGPLLRRGKPSVMQVVKPIIIRITKINVWPVITELGPTAAMQPSVESVLEELTDWAKGRAANLVGRVNIRIM